MIWIDYSIIGLIAISALVGLLRGFFREALSIATWIAAVWIGVAFHRPMAELLATAITHPTARLAAGFLILFLITLFIGGLIGHLVGTMIAKTGLSGLDRIVGLMFGFARGVLIVAIIVLLAGLTPLPNDPWWRESSLLGPFQELAGWLLSEWTSEAGTPPSNL